MSLLGLNGTELGERGRRKAAAANVASVTLQPRSNTATGAMPARMGAGAGAAAVRKNREKNKQVRRGRNYLAAAAKKSA